MLGTARDLTPTRTTAAKGLRTQSFIRMRIGPSALVRIRGHHPRRVFTAGPALRVCSLTLRQLFIRSWKRPVAT